MAIVHVFAQQAVGLAGAVLHCIVAGNAERVETVQVAAGGQDRRCAQQVTPGSGTQEAAIQRTQYAVELMVLGHQAVDVGQLLHLCQGQRVSRAGVLACEHLFGRLAGHQCVDQCARRTHTVRGFGTGQQQVDPLLRGGGLAHHMQAIRDQRVFDFQHIGGELRDACLRLGAPGGFCLRKFEFCRLGLQHAGQVVAFGLGFRLQAAVTLQRALEIHQALVQAGLRDRRCQVTDQRGRSTALGDGAFRRVVRGVQVHVGQVTDEAVGPARR